MRIFMYVLAYDAGFAPNPFHGWCTLACCKPAIRRRARPGDWVVGVTSKGRDHQLVYAMQVEEVLSFREYWSDRRFRAKRPRWKRPRSLVDRWGDNCYRPNGDGRYRQLPSSHWDHKHDREDERAKDKDLGGEHVLVSRRFTYLGERTRPFPPELSSIKRPARGHRVRFTEEEISALGRFLARLPRGVRGRPQRWEKDDGSWRRERPQCT